MVDDAAGSCTDKCTEVTAWLRLVPAQIDQIPACYGAWEGVLVTATCWDMKGQISLTACPLVSGHTPI